MKNYAHQQKIINDNPEKAGLFLGTGSGKTRIALKLSRKKVLVICPKTQAQISAGWQLPDCPVMIFASRTYSYVDYAQAIGRIHRANALKKNLYINLVVRGGIDEAVDRSLANKQDFDERIYLKI